MSKRPYTPPTLRELTEDEAMARGALCRDCGHRPVWRHSWADHCKECSMKGGQPTTVRIDLDRLDAKLGEQLADEVLEACRD